MEILPPEYGNPTSNTFSRASSLSVRLPVLKPDSESFLGLGRLPAREMWFTRRIGWSPERSIQHEGRGRCGSSSGTYSSQLWEVLWVTFSWEGFWFEGWEGLWVGSGYCQGLLLLFKVLWTVDGQSIVSSQPLCCVFFCQPLLLLSLLRAAKAADERGEKEAEKEKGNTDWHPDVGWTNWKLHLLLLQLQLSLSCLSHFGRNGSSTWEMWQL